MLQAHNWFKPMHWKDTDDTQRRSVLENQMFMNQERDGKIKGITMAGRNKQREYISMEDSISPTAAT